MSNKHTELRGVLKDDYSENRLKKPELIFRYKTRSQLVANMISKYLSKKENLNILDYGSAEGLALLELDKIMPNNTYVGVEYSQKLIELAPSLPGNIELHKGDVTRLPEEIRSCFYDSVCALALLEHIKEPGRAVEEAYKNMKEGGVFIATSPNPLWDDISTKLGLLKGGQHETEMTKDLLINICRNAGFKKVYYFRFMWAPISVLPYIKIKVSPSMSLKIDRFIYCLKVFNWLFVNQVVVAIK